MITKLHKTIISNYLRATNSHSKNVYVGRHSERSEESLTFAFCLFYLCAPCELCGKKNILYLYLCHLWNLWFQNLKMTKRTQFENR